ncbi:MAG: hypothetical protein IJ548_03665 [Paludibacteraceae bacterium]|nr:hypothetical protein [Paludibacteraceae bacterium]MBR1556416.1 hypothetical protein [Prevotella sp.]
MDKGQLLSAECGRLGITESWYRGIPTGAGNQIALQWKKKKREPDDSRT